MPFIQGSKNSRSEKLQNSSLLKNTEFESSKENIYRNTTKNLNSTKEYSNSSLDLIYNRSNKDLNFLKTYNYKDKPSFLNFSKNNYANEINFIDRRSIRKNNRTLKMKNNRINSTSEDNIFRSNNDIEGDKFIETIKSECDLDFDKKLKQHRVQQIIDLKLKQNPKEKNVFENIFSKNSNDNYGSRGSNIISNPNLIQQSSLQRLMSLPPYHSIPNSVKFSWVNNPGLEKKYEPRLPRSLLDKEGNSFKHVSHGCSTIFLKRKIEKDDLLFKLLDSNIDLQERLKKVVKIKSVRKIIKLKTSMVFF